MDLIGIDVNLAAATRVWEGLGRPDRAPAVADPGAAGRGGPPRAQDRRGFYRYEDGRRGAVAPGSRPSVAASPRPTRSRPHPRRGVGRGRAGRRRWRRDGGRDRAGPPPGCRSTRRTVRARATAENGRPAISLQCPGTGQACPRVEADATLEDVASRPASPGQRRLVHPSPQPTWRFTQSWPHGFSVPSSSCSLWWSPPVARRPAPVPRRRVPPPARRLRPPPPRQARRLPRRRRLRRPRRPRSPLRLRPAATWSPRSRRWSVTLRCPRPRPTATPTSRPTSTAS